jgi:probable rRNA maturation factor
MSRTLSLQNRQRARRVNTRLLRQLALHLLRHELGIESFELAIHLIDANEMARINRDFLLHEGSTDVVTFDHSDKAGRASRLSRTQRTLTEPSSAQSKPDSLEYRDRLEACPALHGELFICINDAVKQAGVFRTTWQSELVRYLIHGLLHLCGYDDCKAAARRRMKRAENRLLSTATKEFPVSRLAQARKSEIINRKS